MRTTLKIEVQIASQSSRLTPGFLCWRPSGHPCCSVFGALLHNKAGKPGRVEYQLRASPASQGLGAGYVWGKMLNEKMFCNLESSHRDN